MARMQDRARMAIWLAAAMACYAIAHILGNQHPLSQTVAYKAGHVTLLAWIGYWIARNSLGRIYDETSSQRVVARAVLMGCVIIAGSLGL